MECVYFIIHLFDADLPQVRQKPRHAHPQIKGVPIRLDEFSMKGVHKSYSFPPGITAALRYK